MFFEYGDQPGQYGHRALKLGMLRVVYSRRHDGYPPALRLSWGKGAGYVERFGWPAIRRAERDTTGARSSVELRGVTLRIRFGRDLSYAARYGQRHPGARPWFVVRTNANAI
jgi:hypothetical protein